MVEPAGEVDGVADEVEKERDLVGGPAYDESAANHERREDSVTPDRVSLQVAFEFRLDRKKHLITHSIN